MKIPQLSFQQLLLVAFLLIGLLLGGTALWSLLTLDRLMAQSRGSAAQAIALSTAAQSLSERTLAMERSARQSLVLGDRQLLQRFEEAASSARDVLKELEANQLPASHAQPWRQQLRVVERLLEGPLETALERERAIAAEFRELSALNAGIAQTVQAIVAQRNASLDRTFEVRRAQLTRLVAGSLALALMMAAAFGVWLARPFHRLEKAIVALGQNRLDEPVDIRGPADVRRVSQQLDWLRNRLSELDADKARFLRHISHELKTPLAALHEGVAVLNDGVAGALNQDQAEVVRILQHNTESLEHRIETLLRFNAAAFEARELRRASTPIKALIEEQVHAQRLQWQAQALTVRVDGPELVLPVDRDKMASALGNLLSNAIRYSPHGGQVRLSLRREPSAVLIDIVDQGPGVAEVDRSRVFEPFYRGERQPMHGMKGSGIGLSIVQEYVAAHGGKVQLVPTLAGAHFRLELPHAP